MIVSVTRMWGGKGAVHAKDTEKSKKRSICGVCPRDTWFVEVASAPTCPRCKALLKGAKGDLR